MGTSVTTWLIFGMGCLNIMLGLLKQDYAMATIGIALWLASILKLARQRRAHRNLARAHGD